MKSKLEKLQLEVELFAEKVLDLCEKDTEIDSLYKGTQIYFSPIVENPEIMFIGINPGAGYFNVSGEKVKKFIPLEKSEYETDEFTLQTEWSYVFGEKEKINNLPLLYNSPKINFSFLATKTSGDLKKLKSKLRNYLGNEYDLKEKEWIKDIISIVSPKILVCEGFGAFDEIQKLYSSKNFVEDINEKWDYHKVAYLNVNNKNINVIGFSRTYSRFKNIEDVVDTINDFLKQ